MTWKMFFSGKKLGRDKGGVIGAPSRSPGNPPMDRLIMLFRTWIEHTGQ